MSNDIKKLVMHLKELLTDQQSNNQIFQIEYSIIDQLQKDKLYWF